MNTSGVGACSSPLGGHGSDALIFWIAARFLEEQKLLAEYIRQRNDG